MSTTQEFRDGIMRWFRLHTKDYSDGWVPVAAFIEAWSSRLSPSQGTYDLRLLVKEDKLEKRVDYSKHERRGSGWAPMSEYRVKHLIELPDVRTLEALTAPEEGIKWTCHEYIGTEVFAAPEGMSLEDVSCHRGGFALKPVTTRDGIHPGSIVIIQGLLGDLSIYIVETCEDGLVGMSPSREWIAVLEFDTDDRHCWTCGGTGNLKAIQKLDIYKETE